MKKTLLTLALSACMSAGVIASAAPVQAQVTTTVEKASVKILTPTVAKNCTFQMEIGKGSWDKNTHIEVYRNPYKGSPETYFYDFTATPLKNGNLLVETNSWIKQTDGVIHVKIFNGNEKTYDGYADIAGVVDENAFFKSMDFPGMRSWKQNADGTWAWYSNGGRKETYWKDIDGKTYRFTGTLGNMVAGQWFTERNESYYLAKSGALAKNRWVDDNGDWYFVNEKGNPKTGWFEEGGKWYYLQPIDDIYYYYKDRPDTDKAWPYKRQHPGKMFSAAWMPAGDSFYYFGKNGAMKTGWVEIQGKWYYFYGSGKMAKNTTVDGYVIDSNGVWKQ